MVKRSSHRELILNWFKAKKEFNSGIVEGLNYKIKLTLRKAYGYRELKVAEIAIYHALGQLPEPELTPQILLRRLIFKRTASGPLASWRTWSAMRTATN